MSQQPGIIHRILTGFWFLVDQGRRALVNIIFLLLIYLIIDALFLSKPPTVKPGSTLILAPAGYLVDQKDYVDPWEEVVDELDSDSDRVPQTLVKDLITAINQAKADTRINGLVLKLGGLYGGELSKLQDIAEAISDFKTSGKPVIAYSEFYNQAQYYLAANADELYMDPLGTLYIDGYGRYNTYFKDALDKLGINFHIFKVGAYKSAVEPFTRNDMSPEAKEANLDFLNDLWQQYVAEVADARAVDSQTIVNYANQFLSNIETLKGQSSSLAINANLVDKLITRQEMTELLKERFGQSDDGESYQGLGYQAYLRLLNNDLNIDSFGENKIAVIVAKGPILNGEQKPGAIGGDSTAKLLRRAAKDSSVKAIVMRVDSPGGSAYAAEIIRREMLRIKESGTPIVISMGSYAASGGYWISAAADQIWARPSTITGSIGVYGMLPTFEKPMQKLGISSDGVGTTELNGAFDPMKPLRPEVSRAIQNSVEQFYQRFLQIVAESRNMTIEEVHEVAQGRVWSGSSAHELGLVDNLGSLDDALNAAADLAGVVSYKVTYVEHQLSESEQMIKDLLGSQIATDLASPIPGTNTSMPTSVQQIMGFVNSQLKMFAQFNDPSHVYAHCLCELEP